MSRKHIAILGGGAAGLATAYRLARDAGDLDITIFEKEPELGGLARSFTVDGIPVDLGPHRIHTQLPEIQTFLKDFLAEDMFVVRRKSQMYFKGGYFDYPIKLSNAMRHLGVFTIVRFGLSAVAASVRLGSRNGGATSFDDVMKKAFGTAAYEDLIRPYSEKFWKVSPDHIDAEVAKMRVSAGGLKKLIRQVLGRENEADPSALLQFHYLPGGFHDIVLKFEKSFADEPVMIQKDARVTGLFPVSNDGVRVKFTLADAHEKHETFDFCFSTIPLDDLVKMLTQTVPNESALHVADNLRFVSMILVYLVAKKPQISDNSWLYFPEKHLIFNRAYESKNFNPRWKTDNSVLCLEVTCHRGDELWTRSDADIADQVVKQFCSTGMLKESEVDKTVVVRLTHAYPLLTRGYQEKLQVLWRYLSGFPSIISLGRQGLFQHNNTDHAMYMGFRAADLFRRSPSPAQEWYQSEIGRFKNFRIVD